jgi:hypothetical protein
LQCNRAAAPKVSSARVAWGVDDNVGPHVCVTERCAGAWEADGQGPPVGAITQLGCAEVWSYGPIWWKLAQ